LRTKARKGVASLLVDFGLIAWYKIQMGCWGTFIDLSLDKE